MLAAIAVYVPGIGWGLPAANAPDRIRGWATDSIAPVGALAELHHTLVRPTPDRWLAYPLGHHFLIALVYAPYLGWLWLTGGLSSPTSVYPYGLTDPVGVLQRLELIGRAVSVLMGAGIVVCHYRIARTLWDHGTGVMAALLVMLLLPLVYYARTTNLEAPFLFWCSLGTLTYVEMLKFGASRSRVLWLGIFAGIAAGTKDQAYGVFLCMPFVLWFLLGRQRDVRLSQAKDLVPRGVIAFLVFYGMTSGLFVNPERYWAHVQWMAAHNLNPPSSPQHPATLGGYMQLALAVGRDLNDACGAVLLAAGGVGLLIVAVRDRTALLALVPGLVYLLTVILPLRRSMVRYLLPVVLVICLLAARGIIEGIRSGKWRSIPAWGVAVFICVSSLLFAGDLTWQSLYDSRKMAQAWLSEHVHAGDRVAFFEAASDLPVLPAGLTSVRLPSGEGAIPYLLTAAPEIVAVVPAWNSPKNADLPVNCSQEMFQRLRDGSLGYELAARFKTPSLQSRQRLDYPSVNPCVHIFKRISWDQPTQMASEN